MIGSRRNPEACAAMALLAAIAFAAPAQACPQDQVAAFVRDLSAMAAKAETSIRYLIPKFRECGQAAIASELQGSPEWLASMRQHLQAQADSRAELKTTIDTAMGNLNTAESSLQKNYELVLKGIDSMYDNRFPPACRRERTKIVDNMKSVRPMVPDALGKLATFKTCLGG
jgi:hypothetical protein